MVFEVINNPLQSKHLGFTQAQFKKLDALYLKAASHKVLTYRTVECDFDQGSASYTYYKSEYQSPYLQFVISQVGPSTMMYELYLQNKGRIKKSGLFEKTYESLKTEVEKLLSSS